LDVIIAQKKKFPNEKMETKSRKPNLMKM